MDIYDINVTSYEYASVHYTFMAFETKFKAFILLDLYPQ